MRNLHNIKGIVLFDIDGTLLDATGACSDAFVDALSAVFDVDVQVAPDYHFGGRTDAEIAYDLVTAAGLDGHNVLASMQAVWHHYLPALRAGLDEHRPRLQPGVWHVLERLVWERRWLPGLLTGNHEPAAWAKLRAVGIDGYFRFGAFGGWARDRCELPRTAMQSASELLGRDLPAERTVVVGDTPADIDCAKHVGARSIAIASGRFSSGELLEHEPDAVLDDLRDVEAFLSALTPGDASAGPPEVAVIPQMA